MYNSALSDDDILKEYLAVVAPPTPTGVVVQARDTDRAIIRWNMVEGATGYKVYVSADGESFTMGAEVGEVNFAPIADLAPGMEYYIHVVSKNETAESFPAEVMLTTISPALSVHIPLDSLTSEGHVYEALNSLTVAPVGQLVVQAGTENGLGIASTRFVQDELEGIASWANITSFIVNTEINANLMSRTFSLWIKNENPSAYTVPLSIEKRTGMSIAFKNDSIYAFVKQRPQYPAGIDWVADMVGVPYGTSEWSLVTVVYDDPHTKLYINGMLVGTSPGGEWIFPRNWQIGTGDKNAEIGALKDPCAGLVQYLGDTWDPGVRNYFSGSLANIKMYNSAISDDDILKEYLAVVAPPTPTGVVVQARDTDRAIIRWNVVEGATGYKVYVSTDGESFTESAEVADVNFAPISNLTAATEYYVHVVSKDTIAESFPAEVMFTTTDPKLSVHIPLDSLTSEGNVYEAINNLTVAPVGQLVVEAGTENGLGIASTKFVQDELEGISSYANITSFLVSTEINANLMSRTFSLWIKNENPSAYTVPLSIEKRTGMSIAFKNDSIYAFIKQRPQYPAGVDWVADMVGAPHGTSEWSLVTVVYDDPHTKLYINGMLVGTSPGGEWIFPRAWQIGTGDKNAEIGALKDPCAGLVQYLGDTWDPGVRNNFSGKLADIKMYNYALSDTDVMALFSEVATAPSGFVAQAITTDEVLLKWNAVEVETGFRVEYSADGEAYTESGVAAAEAVVHRVTGLTPDMEYHFKVTPVTSGLTAPAMVTATTVAPAMVAQFNFAELGAGGTAIVENISGTEEVFIGDFKLEDVVEVIEMETKTYELNLKSLKITQDELGGVQSYVRLYESILAVAPSLLGRSMTLWIRNTDPTLWTVPFSAEKRTGFAIAFKDEHIWALTKHRPRYPEGTDWVADGVSYPFNSNAWTHVAYVYHDPYTSLYINGAKVATSEGGDWVFPTNIQIAAGGDKSASLGSLLDPDASMVEFLEDNWDPGARRFFDGSVADLRFFNYDLEEDEVAAIMMESLTDITNVSNAVTGNVRVFPNPASHKLTIDAMGDNVEIGIYNIAGSLMISREISGVEQIDISALEAGIYLIKVRNGNSIGVRKFSVLR
jgi:hypothetical protein